MPDGSRDTNVCESQSISEISKMWEDFKIHHVDSLLEQVDAVSSARKEMAKDSSSEWYALRCSSDGTPLISLVENGQKARPKQRNIQYIYLENSQVENYPDAGTREKLIQAGRGNPRPMEDINTLLEVEEDLDVQSLLKKAGGKQEEFVQKLILKEILKSQSHEFQRVLGRSSVFRLPVVREGICLVCRDLGEWEQELKLAVRLSLVEEDVGKNVYYWVSPLFRDEISNSFDKEVRRKCHHAPTEFYQGLLSSSEDYEPIFASELIAMQHSVGCRIWLLKKRGTAAFPKELSRIQRSSDHWTAYCEKYFAGNER